MEKKLDALGVMVSQFYEGGANGSADLLPTDPENKSNDTSKCAMVLPGATKRWRIGFARRLPNGIQHNRRERAPS
jgi:hypothetical protein